MNGVKALKKLKTVIWPRIFFKHYKTAERNKVDAFTLVIKCNSNQQLVQNKAAVDECQLNTHTHPFNGPFFRDYPGEPVSER